MNETSRAAYIFSQSVAALAEIEGMKALNKYREMRGETIAFTDGAFAEVADKYGIGSNDAMGFLVNQGVTP